MINLLHRYIFKELLISFGVSFLFFLFILVLANAFQDLSEMLMSGKLGFQEFFQLILLLIPYLAIYAIPLAVLSGILITFGRMSSEGEITAMKVSGFGLYQISASVFFIAFMSMTFSALVTLHFGPKSVVSYKSILAKTLIDNPLGFIKEGEFVDDFPGYIIYVNEREGYQLNDLWIWELDESNQFNLFLKAREGTLEYAPRKNAIMLDLFGGSIEQRSGMDFNDIGIESPKILYFKELPISLPLDEALNDYVAKPIRYKDMTLAQLLERRTQLIKEEIKLGESFSQERGKLQLYVHQNLSQAYSVFALVLIGIPLAMHVGRKESYINIILALLIALSYHTLFVFVSWFEGIGGFRSDILVWVPNIIFQLLGIVLFAKALKH